MQDIINDRKNGPALLAISMAMRISRYDAKRIAQYGRSRATLDATERNHRANICPYRPGARHGHRFWRNTLSCGFVKSLFEASVQKAWNGPSTQLIEAVMVQAWVAQNLLNVLNILRVFRCPIL